MKHRIVLLRMPNRKLLESTNHTTPHTQLHTHLLNQPKQLTPTTLLNTLLWFMEQEKAQSLLPQITLGHHTQDHTTTTRKTKPKRNLRMTTWEANLSTTPLTPLTHLPRITPSTRITLMSLGILKTLTNHLWLFLWIPKQPSLRQRIFTWKTAPPLITCPGMAYLPLRGKSAIPLKQLSSKQREWSHKQKAVSSREHLQANTDPFTDTKMLLNKPNRNPRAHMTNTITKLSLTHQVQPR